ncbi:MAG TPA: phospholipase D family protein [Tepidisphaeraceae bacterium]|jgi:phosphatidylserine/phosphatidylglycerophosphate/cardiolipin synthase-like enzyme
MLKRTAPILVLLTLALPALAQVKLSEIGPVTERPKPAAEQDGIAIYFSPDGGAADAVVYQVGRAKNKLDIAAYSITHVRIAKAVIDAHRRGVTVRVVMDTAQAAGRYSSATTLFNAGISVRIDTASGLMHHKIAIIDGQTILTGSFNWTKGGDESNAENLVVMEGKRELVSAYQTEFDRVVEKSKPYERPNP